MAEIPSSYLVHTVDVEPYAGATGSGDTFGTLQQGVPCFQDDKTRLVRDSTGTEVTSSTTLFLRLSRAASFQPKSKVHLEGGRVARVIGVARRTDKGAFGAWQHLEVTLT